MVIISGYGHKQQNNVVEVFPKNPHVLLSFVEEEKAKKDPKYFLNRANKDTLGILSELEKTYKEPVSSAVAISHLQLYSPVLCYFTFACEQFFHFSLLPDFSRVDLHSDMQSSCCFTGEEEHRESWITHRQECRKFAVVAEMQNTKPIWSGNRCCFSIIVGTLLHWCCCQFIYINSSSACHTAGSR